MLVCSLASGLAFPSAWWSVYVLACLLQYSLVAESECSLVCLLAYSSESEWVYLLVSMSVYW